MNILDSLEQRSTEATGRFTVKDAASNAAILRGELPLNRVCLHIGVEFYGGTEALARELGRLYPGEGITFKGYGETRYYVRRSS